jgi:hypothetical protein
MQLCLMTAKIVSSATAGAGASWKEAIVSAADCVQAKNHRKLLITTTRSGATRRRSLGDSIIVSLLEVSSCSGIDGNQRCKQWGAANLNND